MKRFLLIASLACAAVAPLYAAPAHAAPPTDAQVDRLLETMNIRHTLDEMFTQMQAVSDSMTAQMLGEDASAEQRESARRITRSQMQAMRKTMSWDTMAPVYRRIYTRLFTAEEVDAMIAFYGSDTGRGIMRKLPQAMQLTTEEMQPMLQQMMTEMRTNLENEMQRSGENAGENVKEDAKEGPKQGE